MNLSFYELLGDADKINHEFESYSKIHSDDFKRVAQNLFRKENCSVLKVKSTTNA
jgi:hypothetical protein